MRQLMDLSVGSQIVNAQKDDGQCAAWEKDLEVPKPNVPRTEDRRPLCLGRLDAVSGVSCQASAAGPKDNASDHV